MSDGDKAKLEAEYAFNDTESYKDDLAMSTTAALLQRLFSEDVVTKGFLFQVNWGELMAPTDTANLTSNAFTIWFKSSLRHLTGVVDVWVREVAVLGLLAVTTEEFLEAAVTNKLNFPLLLSCCIMVSPGKNQERSTLVLVEASAQDLAEFPRLNGLVEHMKCCAMSSATTWPCRLAGLEAHPLYNFAVNTIGNTVHCQRALVLVKTKKSTLLEQIEGGFKAVTHQIQCGLDSADASFTCRSVCLLEQALKFRMEPIRPGEDNMPLPYLPAKMHKTSLLVISCCCGLSKSKKPRRALSVF